MKEQEDPPPKPTTCPNCDRPIEEEEMFCSMECERDWLRREVAKGSSEGVFFCPNCGSTQIKMAIPGLMPNWRCMKCGGRGPLAIKDGVMRDKIRESYDEKTSDGSEE
jgi:predicted RNA-binding Zn-ribbon protein involved in translation (DUF1610 family)